RVPSASDRRAPARDLHGTNANAQNDPKLEQPKPRRSVHCHRTVTGVLVGDPAPLKNASTQIAGPSRRPYLLSSSCPLRRGSWRIGVRRSSACGAPITLIAVSPLSFGS